MANINKIALRMMKNVKKELIPIFVMVNNRLAVLDCRPELIWCVQQIVH
jgi:hypothetical protein